MKKRIIITLLIVPCVLILFWFSAIIKCEVFTGLHGNEFKGKYEDTLNLDCHFKVLNYSDNTARIYYVFEDEISYLAIIKYVKINGKWEIEEEEKSFWSDDGVVWPYIFDSVLVLISIVIYGIPLGILMIIIICVWHKIKKRKRNVLP